MNLENQIYIRKSCRDYLDEKMDFDIVHDFMKSVKPLNDDIEYAYEILHSEEMNIRTRWSAPHYIALYSQKKENYLENTGFIFQQLCLHLQSAGIGNCWVGLASPKKKHSSFVIAIAIGKSENMTRDLTEFKRKSLSEISDSADERLVPAQLAPSAINSQPWFFRQNKKGFDVYQIKQNILKRQVLKKWNPIDMGIAMAHMYVANEDTFQFKIRDDSENIKGYSYIGSIEI